MTKDETLRMLDELLPLDPNPTMFLATWDGRCPRVRPMALVRDGLRFYIGTCRNDAKSKQIASCPTVEFVATVREGDYTGYLRVTGRAVEVTGQAKHEAWARGMGFDVKEYSPGGLDDRRWIVFRIEPETVCLMAPGEATAMELPLAWFA